MRKVTIPLPEQRNKFIFTEGINYFKTGINSIWGEGDALTRKVLQSKPIAGKWLNLAAGDGRYNDILLTKADHVVAADIDRGALSKLWHITPKHLRSKLSLKEFNLEKPFPYSANEFDGVFCVGTLHLFPESVLEKIISEITRVLKHEGTLILDFATERKKILPSGKLLKFKTIVEYSHAEAEKMLRKLLKGYNIKFSESEVHEEEFKTKKLAYTFNCKFWLVAGKKN